MVPRHIPNWKGRESQMAVAPGHQQGIWDCTALGGRAWRAMAPQG